MGYVPPYLYDDSLLWKIFMGGDDAGAKAAEEFLDLTGIGNLPAGTFFAGEHVNRVYSTPHGFNISFVHKNIDGGMALKSAAMFWKKIPFSKVFAGASLVDEDILQPLWKKQLSKNLIVEINPGVHSVGVGRDEVEEMREGLAKKKIDFFNPDPKTSATLHEFIGTLRTPDGAAVNLVTNRRAVGPMALYNAPENPTDGVQTIVYGPLRQRMADAFQSARQDKVLKAFGECERIASLPEGDPNKILTAHWKGKGLETERRKTIAQAAKNLELMRLAA